ncbi:DNA mismatch repair protein [Arachis hypogaea]|uniref:DNA mismatch repair protein n=1 Tax=Arachis hypogaea TaxID=3818 RepID=A0A6B9VBY9_ARAHY|nr:DNA mismatch repair protein [Arachis hypogaea]
MAKSIHHAMVLIRQCRTLGQSRCPSSSHSSVIDIDADSGRCSWRRVPKLPSLVNKFHKILKNNSDGSENGSLQQIMNRTLNIFGSRLLRHWVRGASSFDIPPLNVEFLILSTKKITLSNCSYS